MIKHDQMLALVDQHKDLSLRVSAGYTYPPAHADHLADALATLLEENKRLRGALKPLADEAFQNMAGGKGHLIDDAYCALKGDTP